MSQNETVAQALGAMLRGLLTNARVGLVIAAFVAVVLVGLWAAKSTWGWVADLSNGQMTVYPVTCAQVNDSGKCEALVWLPPMTFKPVVEKQMVVLGLSDGTNLQRLEDCIVLNRTSWSCRVNPAGVLTQVVISAASGAPTLSDRSVRLYGWWERLGSTLLDIPSPEYGWPIGSNGTWLLR